MVNIDTVYQRVLILANKEQRGYITPQEFNLYANQAQMEIFEQYFYDLNQAHRNLGNDTVHADVDDMIEEKMQIFEATADSSEVTTWNDGIPGYVYRISAIEIGGVDCEILSTKDFREAINGSYLTRPSAKRPIAHIRGSKIITPYGARSNTVYYFRKPNKASWGYFVLNSKALYDSSSSKTTHFELHPAEETVLVYKILKFAGLGMRRDDVAQGGQGLESLQVQQEKQ